MKIDPVKEHLDTQRRRWAFLELASNEALRELYAEITRVEQYIAKRRYTTRKLK